MRCGLRGASEAAVMPFRAARAAILVLLLLTAPVFGKPDIRWTDRDRPFMLFAEAVRARASLTINRQNLPPHLAPLAAQIAQDLNDMTEQPTGRKGDQFGVSYEVVVWKADIPDDYRDVLVESLSERRPGTGFGRRPRISMNTYPAGPESGGLLPNTDCMGIDQPGWKNGLYESHPAEPFGDFGWPCEIGGSVSVIQTTANTGGPALKCLVFYLPDRDGADRDAVQAIRARYESALNTAVGRQPRITDAASNDKIGLMTLAFDIDENYVKAWIPGVTLPPDRTNKMEIARVRMRGIAIIPTQTELIGHGSISEECGLWTPRGFLVFVSMPIPFPLDLNGEFRTLNLQILAVPNMWQ